MITMEDYLLMQEFEYGDSVLGGFEEEYRHPDMKVSGRRVIFQENLFDRNFNIREMYHLLQIYGALMHNLSREHKEMYIDRIIGTSDEYALHLRLESNFSRTIN